MKRRAQRRRWRGFGVVGLLLALVLGTLGFASPASAATLTSASDSFTRTTANGLGTADAGGAWALAGTANRFAVGSGTARFTTDAATQVSGYLAATAIQDTDVSATLGVSAAPAGGPVYLGVLARHSATTDYTGRITVRPGGSVSVSVLAGGVTVEQVVVAGLAAYPSSGVRIRFQATGASPTTLRARAWKTGTTEPATWQISTTDSTGGLQSAGAVGVRAYLSSGATNGPIVQTVDDLTATSLTASNAAPTASFTTTPSGLQVAVDGRGSSDPDGMIASYAWTFGDGATGTGVTANHTYTTGGSYTVTLIVTDNSGATGTSSRQLTVTPLNRSPVPTLLEQSNALTASFWGNQSLDPDGTVVGYTWTFGDGSAGSTASTSHVYAAPGTYTVSLTVTDNGGATATTHRGISVYASGVRPTQVQWRTDLSAAIDGGTAYLDVNKSVPKPAIVLDIDNTALQSYYQPRAATPAVLTFEQRAITDGYAILFATGRTLDGGGTVTQLQSAGYRVDSLCFKDPTASSTPASKTACRAAWASQGYTIVASVGNHTTDLDGGNSGQEYLLPNYNFLD